MTSRAILRMAVESLYDLIVAGMKTQGREEELRESDRVGWLLRKVSALLSPRCCMLILSLVAPFAFVHVQLRQPSFVPRHQEHSQHARRQG